MFKYAQICTNIENQNKLGQNILYSIIIKIDFMISTFKMLLYMVFLLMSLDSTSGQTIVSEAGSTWIYHANTYNAGNQYAVFALPRGS